MVPARRIVAVTLGLVGAGAIFGAVAGAVALGFSLLITHPSWPVVDGLAFGAFLGAPLGAASAPVLSWLLLRRVPLGRLFVGLVAGTVFGGIVAWFTTTPGGEIESNGLAGACIGCLVACVWLRFGARDAH
jgi:hypothetical protein